MCLNGLNVNLNKMFFKIHVHTKYKLFFIKFVQQIALEILQVFREKQKVTFRLKVHDYSVSLKKNYNAITIESNLYQILKASIFATKVLKSLIISIQTEYLNSILNDLKWVYK